MQRLVQPLLRLCPLDLGALTIGALLVSGCGSTPIAQHPNPLYPQGQPPQYEQGHPDWRQQPGRMSTDRQPPTAEQIDRLLAKLDALEYDNAVLKKQISDQYMQAVKDRQASRVNGANNPASINTATALAANTGAQPNQQQPQPARPVAQNPSVNTQNVQPVQTMSRQQLTSALLDRIAVGTESDHIKALMAAAVSVSSTGHDIDPRLLDSLKPRTREQVARFHQMVAMTFDELAANPNKPVTRAEMIANIDKVFGVQPLSIESLKLCRRVDSFGVYQTFATKKFLSGRKNRMLVYVEVDNFYHEPTSDGGYEVKLEQQIELYDATGETTVWRAGPDILVDACKNKRRDFFIVYPIELPARLTAGKYRLKVRLADKHSNSICEKTLHDIEIVADQALVGGNR